MQDTLFHSWRSQPAGKALRWSALLAVTVSTPLLTPLAFAQIPDPEMADLDQDGVADVNDIDQDNDGIINTLEGVQRLTNLSGSPAHHYAVNPSNSSSRELSVSYDLVSTVDGHTAQLTGSVMSSDTLVEWSLHNDQPKLRNLTSGSSVVQWTVAGAAGDIDFTISDLDGLRSETVAVSINSIVGYSLSLNSNIAVNINSDKIIFTGTGAGGDSIDDLVTLHFRGNSANMELTYSNRYLVADNQSDNLSGDIEIAGFRHSLQHFSYTYFTPVTRHRDTDADGVADHRDLDSDNDGLGDVIESGGIDSDNDNLIDGAVDANGLSINVNPDHTPTTVAAVYQADRLVSGDDSDGDGLLSSIDAEPDQFGGSRTGTDSDNDGLDDLDEIRIYLTDPGQSDSDLDGLGDAAEINQYHTDPLQTDSDNDGLSDSDEINQHETNPNNIDSDVDGKTDSEEIKGGTDPLVFDAIVVESPVVIVTPSVRENEPVSPVEPEPDLRLETEAEEMRESADGTLPGPDALLADDALAAYTASLRTGLSGAGCSLMTSSGRSAPLLPLIACLALAALARNSRRRNASA